MPSKNKRWFTLKNEGDEQPVKVWVHGDIGAYDIEAMDLIRALQSVGTQDAEFRVQSYGGSVYEGLSMYNAIRAHKGKTVAIVDGLAASIATYFLMACDEIQMPENAYLMIHNPSMGAWGGESELESALTQLKNSKQTIAEAYAERCGKPIHDVLAAMHQETWFTAQEALEFGLIDKVVDAVDLSNCLQATSEDALKAFKQPPAVLMNHLKPVPDVPEENTDEPEGEPDPIEPPPLAASAKDTNPPQQVTENMSKPTDNAALLEAAKKENSRQSAIRALCAQHKVKDTLRDEMLNDVNCSESDAAQKILAAIGAHSAAGSESSTPDNISDSHIRADNGNITKDSLQNALLARCDVAELESDNPYKLKTLLDMAEIAIGGEASKCSSRNELVARAFNSGDFAEIITESIRTVMVDEKKLRAPLFRQLANTENLPNFKETDLVTINDAPDLMNVSEDGEYKSALLTGSGEKIQLATFGREIGFTRQAIINDEIALISKVPRKFMQSGYRLADKLYFNAIFSGKMADEKGIFLAPAAKKWGNLRTNIPKNDYQALIMALHKSFATTVSSGGDPLDLRGELLLANPDHAGYLEAVLNTASKPDTFNPAYKKFDKVIETARMADVNGAIALTGKDFDSVVMGFLDGQTDPWLETSDGWTTEGAKFRITYDITAKVVDRRGVAKAEFNAS